MAEAPGSVLDATVPMSDWSIWAVDLLLAIANAGKNIGSGSD